MKTLEAKGFFQFEIIINVLVNSADSFEYLCYVITAIRNIFTLTLQGPTSSHHPQEVLLAQFSLYVHKGGLKPDSFHFYKQLTCRTNRRIYR